MAWWALPAALGAAGAFAGGQQDVTQRGIKIGQASELENQAGNVVGQNLSQLQQQVGLGPGSGEVSAGLVASQKLAAQLEQYAQGGFLPSQADWTTAGQFAQQAYQPQQVALNQQFQQEQQRANQLAAQLGRPINDPIIQAKLSQERTQAQERLGAAQGAYASQYAQSLPQQRLGYTAQLADVRNSLASQAMSNRQALLSLGSQLQQQERNFRLATGEQYQSSGGGLKGALQGGLAGFGSGLGAAGFIQKMGWGGTDNTPTPNFVGGGQTYGFGGQGTLGYGTQYTFGEPVQQQRTGLLGANLQFK